MDPRCLDELVGVAEVPGAEEVLDDIFETLLEEKQGLESDEHDDLLDAPSGRPVQLKQTIGFETIEINLV